MPRNSRLNAPAGLRMNCRGCRKAYLLVAPENYEVTHFYERRGWAVMDVLPLGKEFVVSGA